VAQDPQREPVRDAAVPVVELGEGAFLAPRDEREQRLVGEAGEVSVGTGAAIVPACSKQLSVLGHAAKHYADLAVSNKRGPLGLSAPRPRSSVTPIRSPFRTGASSGTTAVSPPPKRPAGVAFVPSTTQIS